jgi:hypothetical protein
MWIHSPLEADRGRGHRGIPPAGDGIPPGDDTGEAGRAYGVIAVAGDGG